MLAICLFLPENWQSEDDRSLTKEERMKSYCSMNEVLHRLSGIAKCLCSLIQCALPCSCATGVSLFVLATALGQPALGQNAVPTPVQMERIPSAHPRLFLHDADIPAIKRRIAEDAFAKGEFESLQKRAEELLLEPPCGYDLHKVEPTLLWIAREIESRVLTLAGVYRLTGDRRFAGRALAEMVAASQFPDWNPSHFLDTAELTTALGIGYDWLYPMMSEETRQTVRDAIVRLGIQPFLKGLEAGQMRYHNNWVQVVYGGETVGALAVAENADHASMERAERVLGVARSEIVTIMKLFDPDGGFEEGPSYWNYATIYNVLYLDALASVSLSDGGASNAPSFAQTPNYRIQAMGPTHLFANFGDAHEEPGPAPQMYWFARKFHRGDYAVEEMPVSKLMRTAQLPDGLIPTRRFQFLGLLWYALAPKPTLEQHPQRIQSFARIGNVYMRTAWNDPDAWYVAFRGGLASLSHSHLDLGSFLLDGLGERWGVDLGPDSYALPDYFGARRWNYYRVGTASHNTLTVNARNESPASGATILHSGESAGRLFAVMDLDSTYPSLMKEWKRGIAIEKVGTALLQDEYTAAAGSEVMWHFHTRASVTILAEGPVARLEEKGKVLYVKIMEPMDGRFAAEPSIGGPKEAANPGVTDLTIRRKATGQPERIAVFFAGTMLRNSPVLENLTAWK